MANFANPSLVELAKSNSVWDYSIYSPTASSSSRGHALSEHILQHPLQPTNQQQSTNHLHVKWATYRRFAETQFSVECGLVTGICRRNIHLFLFHPDVSQWVGKGFFVRRFIAMSTGWLLVLSITQRGTVLNKEIIRWLVGGHKEFDSNNTSTTQQNLLAKRQLSYPQRNCNWNYVPSE